MSSLLLIAFDAEEAVLGAGFAQSFAGSYDLLLVTGGECLDLGAKSVFCAGLPEVPTADSVSRALGVLAGKYTHIASVSSMRSKDILARVAGCLRCGMVSDVIGFSDEKTFKRAVVAGSLFATVAVEEFPVVLTFRPSNFKKTERFGESCCLNVSLELESKSLRVSSSSRGSARPDLSTAKVVISGGRPLKNAENFEKVIGGLADHLGGAVGATRAAVDSGIAANELQVGQTGKIVAPDLYIAAGISGSTQHMAGIKDSKLIVAINTDKDAPIFEVADLGIVADLYEVIPALIAKTKKV